MAYKPHLYRYTAYLFLAGAFICFFIELIVALLISAFSKHKEEDDEAEYNRYYGNVVKYDENPKKSDVGKEIKKATKESAASLDDDLLLEEADEMEVDIQTDKEPDLSNEDSSSEIIGKIPR